MDELSRKTSPHVRESFIISIEIHENPSFKHNGGPEEEDNGESDREIQ
jgi:hypothetical protein